MSTTLCSSCHESVPSYDTIHRQVTEGVWRALCSRCFSRDVARTEGYNFQHVRFDPVELLDVNGVAHQFHFRTQLTPHSCVLGAVEVKDGKPLGYEFEVSGDPEGNPFALMAQLLARMHRGLALRHLQDGPDAETGIEGRVVRGRITWDKQTEGRVPLLVIDGRQISWEEFGRMLMTFEGWHLKLELHEGTEEI